METSFVILNAVVFVIAGAFFIGGSLTNDRKQREHAVMGGFMILGAMSLMNFTYGVACVDNIIRPLPIVIGVLGFALSVLGGYVSNKLLAGKH